MTGNGQSEPAFSQEKERTNELEDTFVTEVLDGDGDDDVGSSFEDTTIDDGGASLNEMGSFESDKMSIEEQNSALRTQLSDIQAELEYWKFRAVALEKKNTPQKPPSKKNSNKQKHPPDVGGQQQHEVGVWQRGLDGLWKIATPQKAFLKAKESFNFGQNADSADVSVELPNRCIESGLHHRRTSTEKPIHQHQVHYDDGGGDDDESYVHQERNALIKAHASDYDENSTIHSDGEDSTEQTFIQSLADRGGWLVGLLVVQSLSSFILKSNEQLLQRHAVIVRFLTMLVGAGGNAGNQASVRVIRGLATGKVDDENVRPYLLTEFRTGFFLSILLGTAGCIRAAIFLTPAAETLAITASLFMIVVISILLGTTLPLLMKHVGIDPAHSSTSIQVIMDILGVAITVHVCSLVLDHSLTAGLIAESIDNDLPLMRQ